MKKYALLAFAALISAGSAVPAAAALLPIGQVDFSLRDSHDAVLGNFKGMGVGLTAHESDVVCDSVMATFGNGDRREIFRGPLPQGETVMIDLPPGEERSIDRVDFVCHADNGDRAIVDIAADTDGFGHGGHSYYEPYIYGRDFGYDRYYRRG